MDDEGYYEDHCDCGLDENHEDDYLDDGNYGEGHGLDVNHEVNDDLDEVGVDHVENHDGNHEQYVNHG